MSNKTLDDYDFEAAALLELTYFARELHLLPRQGGVLDQDSYFIHFFNHIIQLQNKREELDRRTQQMKDGQLSGQRP